MEPAKIWVRMCPSWFLPRDVLAIFSTLKYVKEFSLGWVK